MSQGFKDRYEELRELDAMFRSDRFEFLIIYGRRRIGKTALVLEATKGMRSVYFLSERIDNDSLFHDACAAVVPEAKMIAVDLHYLLEFMVDRVDAIIIDEFQNWIAEDEGVLNVLQAEIDGPLRTSRL